jgi:hypothetical protein
MQLNIHFRGALVNCQRTQNAIVVITVGAKVVSVSCQSMHGSYNFVNTLLKLGPFHHHHPDVTKLGRLFQIFAPATGNSVSKGLQTCTQYEQLLTD